VQGVTYGNVWVEMIVEVDVTGFTIGTVLQMTVDEVDWLTRAVCEVTTVVEVLVLVTRCGLVNLPLTAMSSMSTYRRKS
jgi:hypothetical protein